MIAPDRSTSKSLRAPTLHGEAAPAALERRRGEHERTEREADDRERQGSER